MTVRPEPTCPDCVGAAGVRTSGRPHNDRDGACICDYNPDTTGGPLEDCPFHGRPYAYWVERSDSLGDRLAAVTAQRERALAALPPECWVTRSTDILCTDAIGSTFPNGAVFTEAACCLPCLLRAALAPEEPPTPHSCEAEV